MLNKKQARLTKRNQEVKKVFDADPEMVGSYAPFKKKVDEFLVNIGVVDEKLPDKDVTGTGATDGKITVKEQVAELAGNICSLAKPYAMETGNSVLFAGINYSYSGILEIADYSLLGSITAIYKLLNPLVKDEVFATYLITQDMLDKMLNAATTFSNQLGDAQLITISSRVANKNINKALSDANENIVQLSLLINHFKDTNSDFVNNYRAAVRINNSGIQHSGIEGIITDAKTGMPIQAATLVLEGTKKQTVSDLRGNYQLIKVLSKTFKLIVSAPGYESKTIVIKISRGVVSKLNIEL